MRAALLHWCAGKKRNVEALLHQAEQGEVRLLAHRVTLAEVYYDVLRSSGKEKADLTFSVLEALAMEVSYDLDTSFIQTLSKYKVAHKISFADSLVLALAETQNATVVTSPTTTSSGPSNKGACYLFRGYVNPAPNPFLCTAGSGRF